MLLLCFHLGKERYALPSEAVEMVLPYVSCRRLPLAPAWFKGLMVYQGQAVPVIDLCHIAKKREACRQLGTRILLMNLSWQGEHKKVGFLVENMTQTCRASELRFEDTGVAIEDSPWLGQVAYDGKTLLQLLKPEAFLTDDVGRLLFDVEMTEAVG
ncbi:MAG: chemotaxis protein CheW [Mariprofundaceae bacterium]|nr:chemotaxis protein CheW [Mariprofundaceae bacterium]